MEDPEDRVYHLPRIVKSSVKSAVPRQEQLDNSNRPRTVAIKTATAHGAGLRNPNRAKAAIKSSIGGPVLDNPNRERNHPVSDGALNHHPPRAKAAIKHPIDGANNYNRVKTAAKHPIGGNAHPIDQELDERPQSHIDHPPPNSANPASHVASRPPRKVTFDVADFPLPVERRSTARNRVGQNAGRLNPGFASSGARESRASFPSKSASFFPERPSRAGAGGRSMADVQRRGRGALSSNGTLDQHRRTATKTRPIHSHRYAESRFGKHARKFEGASGRPSLVPRMTSASRDDNQDDLIDGPSGRSGGGAFYISAGLTLASLRRDESSESSDSDSVEVVDAERVEVKAIVKAARKFQLGRKSKQAPHEKQPSVTPPSTQSSEQSGDDGPADPVAHEDSDELEYVDLDMFHLNDAREQASSPSEPGVSEGDEAPSEMPSDALIEALEDISLMTIRLASLHRLPFMLRNLREGFLSRCKSLGIDTSRSFPPPKPITVVYSCAARIAEDRSPERQVTRTTMRDWKCPFCELHGTFLARQILSAHLRWDHSNVDFEWDMLNYTLTLWLPLLVLSPLIPSSRLLTTPTTRTASTEISDFSSNKTFSDKNTPTTTQPTSRYTSVSSQSFHDSSLLDTKPKYYLPTPSRTGSVVSTNARSSTVSSRALSRASSIRTPGNPAPPPQSDPLGPAAQYPYLPESHSDGVYSCRLGGPRLYDLLNSMSLEPFGVLAWVILDREEEIFEIDDVRDEDKVMQALWLRWIFLNRNKFVANFFNGTKSFIRDNWRMIHQAAGLGALRTWLLCLNVNNFLVTPDVVALLRFYRGLTGMKHWYDDTHAAQNEVPPV